MYILFLQDIILFFCLSSFYYIAETFQKGNIHGLVSVIPLRLLNQLFDTSYKLPAPL